VWGKDHMPNLEGYLLTTWLAGGVADFVSVRVDWCAAYVAGVLIHAASCKQVFIKAWVAFNLVSYTRPHADG
jgi:hypothetical protein